MKFKIGYGESKKDATGNLFTYRADIEKDVDESAMTGEQQLAKVRQMLAFIHAEIHKSIEQEQIRDGILSPEEAIHNKPTNGNKPQ
jgi:hypothetical protein